MRKARDPGGCRARRWLVGATAVAVLLAGVSQAGALDTRSEVRNGGIFRVSYAIGSGIDHLDPALAYTAPAWALLDTTCLRLMSYPDKPAPQSFRLVPEAATGPPKVSRNGTTYTFTVRRGFRFSDGKPVRANAFARAIARVLDPRQGSPWRAQLSDVVGVTARGYTLTIRFARPPVAVDVRTAMPYMCAVPPTLPVDPEGRAVIPAAGPYSVVEYRPDERVVLRRNRFYAGTRPHHVEGFQVDLRAPSPREMVLRVDRNEADWGHSVAGVFYDPSIQPALWRRHGLNAERFHSQPGFTVRLLVFNASRPLFRDNPELRRAINLALDRSALRGGPLVGVQTDQYLPHAMPGFHDEDVYPLEGSDLARARELARGNLREGKAVMYTTDFPPAIGTAMAVRAQLAQIGLDVEVKPIQEHFASAAYAGQLARPGEPWDIAYVLWGPPIPDPWAFLNALLDTDFIGGSNLGGFSSATIDVSLRNAARTPQASSRQRAYGQLDPRLARVDAPLATFEVLNEVTFVSSRVDRRCVVLRPALDLAAVCLK